jgi:phosphoglycerol transferase MdoB-like AlkP superfamily enzyme
MEELRKVPLIIKLPDENPRYQRDTIGGLIDFAPTISTILGIDISATCLLGKDLMNGRDSFVVFRDGSYVSKDKQLDTDDIQNQLAISDLILEKDLMNIRK